LIGRKFTRKAGPEVPFVEQFERQLAGIHLILLLSGQKSNQFTGFDAYRDVVAA